MTCPRAPEIKAKLLSPHNKVLLQKYIHRWKRDPNFLVFHQASIALSLRQELNLSHAKDACEIKCHHHPVAECQLTEVLQEAMEERIAEEGIEAS